MAATSIFRIVLLLAMASPGAADEGEYFEGNAVEGRNVPPLKGCTVAGKFWEPLSPTPGQPYIRSQGWDWCQQHCQEQVVTDPYGTPVTCTHFAFYPDGSCFIQGNAVTLVDDTEGPYAHGFRVISGPRDCGNRSTWADPNYNAEGAPVLPQTPVPAAETTAAPERLIHMNFALQGLDYATVVANPEQRGAVEAAVKTSVATHLGVPESDMTVTLAKGPADSGSSAAEAVVRPEPAVFDAKMGFLQSSYLVLANTVTMKVAGLPDIAGPEVHVQELKIEGEAHDIPYVPPPAAPQAVPPPAALEAPTLPPVPGAVPPPAVPEAPTLPPAPEAVPPPATLEAPTLPPVQPPCAETACTAPAAPGAVTLAPELPTVPAAPGAVTLAPVGSGGAGPGSGDTGTGAGGAAAPAAEAPALHYVAEGEKCNPSLGPEHGTLCNPGFTCFVHTENGLDPMPGAAGICRPDGYVEGPAAAGGVRSPDMPSAEVANATLNEADLPPEGATVHGWHYAPVTMPLSVKLFLPSWRACHQTCAWHPYCEHWGYWPDHGCHLQGNNVTLVRDENNLDVITGPRNLTDQSTWPQVPEGAVIGVASTAQPATTGQPVPASGTEAAAPQAPKPEVPVDQVITKQSGGGVPTLVWVVLLVVILVAIGLGVAYCNGVFDDDDDDPTDEDVDGGEDLEDRSPSQAALKEPLKPKKRT